MSNFSALAATLLWPDIDSEKANEILLSHNYTPKNTFLQFFFVEAQKKRTRKALFLMLPPTYLEALSNFFLSIRPPIVSLPYLHYSRALSEYSRSIYFTFITPQEGHPKVKRKEDHLTFFLTSCFLLVCLPYPCMESHSGCLSWSAELFLFMSLFPLA